MTSRSTKRVTKRQSTKRRKPREATRSRKSQPDDVLAWVPQSELPPIEIRMERA